jgi:hypothetical protein
MGDDIRVTVVATGLGKAKKHVQLVPQQMLRTGTHNAPMVPSAAMGGAAATTVSMCGQQHRRRCQCCHARHEGTGRMASRFGRRASGCTGEEWYEQYDIPAFCASKLTKIYPRPANRRLQAYCAFYAEFRGARARLFIFTFIKEIIMTIKIGDTLPEGTLSEFIETETEGCAGPEHFQGAGSGQRQEDRHLRPARRLYPDLLGTARARLCAAR